MINCVIYVNDALKLIFFFTLIILHFGEILSCIHMSLTLTLIYLFFCTFLTMFGKHFFQLCYHRNGAVSMFVVKRITGKGETIFTQ